MRLTELEGPLILGWLNVSSRPERGCHRRRMGMAPIARFDRLRTDRLVMRRWQDGDREPFAALNADPHTMRFFPSTLDRAESDAMIDRLEERFEAQGFGLWALETAHNGPVHRLHRAQPDA
jgi:RimJ/RimL family protein N-acetyltransferase